MTSAPSLLNELHLFLIGFAASNLHADSNVVLLLAWSVEYHQVTKSATWHTRTVFPSPVCNRATSASLYQGRSQQRATMRQVFLTNAK